MSNTQARHATYSMIDALAEFGIHLSFELATTRQLVNDSRAVKAGDIFCAVVGSAQTGNQFIEKALQAGASLVINECQTQNQHGKVEWLSTSENNADGKVAMVSFYQLNFNLFALAQAYYQHPQKQLTLIGITGTNGKTSTSQLIANLLTASGKSCAVIGTNGAGNINNIKGLTPLNNTTPGATQLCQLLAGFVDEKINYVAMEVSSHALAQRRVTSDIFPLAVFTNLTRDHLDYHQTMENYADAKRELFTGDEKQVAIINGDDETAKTWLKAWPNNQQVMVYGKTITTAYKMFAKAEQITHHQQGVSFLLKTHLGDIAIQSNLIGDFNIDNLLAAICVLMIESKTTEQETLKNIALHIKTLPPILGRMESFSQQGLATTVVDYAHTPDALKNALLACRQHCHGALWVVFGCGGDRDKGKRPLMGQIAEQYADNVVITNDNPRNEDAKTIVDDIIKGCQQHNDITINLDRKTAVLATLKHAKAGDIVLLAGKGHEDYIVMGDEHIFYDERAVVAKYYQQGAMA